MISPTVSLTDLQKWSPSRREIGKKKDQGCRRRGGDNFFWQSSVGKRGSAVEQVQDAQIFSWSSFFISSFFIQCERFFARLIAITRILHNVFCARS